MFVPLLIWFLYDVIYVKKNVLMRLQHYCILFVSMVWLSLIWFVIGTIKTDSRFYEYFLFKSDQDAANLSFKFTNPHYLLHLYYSLQRRIVFYLAVGCFFLIKTIRKGNSFLLLTFSLALVVSLSFSQKNNNWYLMPSMPF